MFILFFLLCFWTKLLVMQCDQNINIHLVGPDEKCVILPIEPIEKGQSINIHIRNNGIRTINSILFSTNHSAQTTELPVPKHETVITKITPETDVVYNFTFLYLRGVQSENIKYFYKGQTYHNSSCEIGIRIRESDVRGKRDKEPSYNEDQTPVGPINATNVTVLAATVNPTDTTPGIEAKWVYIGTSVAAAVMVGMTSTIFYYKAKASKLNTTRNLSTRHNVHNSDIERYSRLPGAKGLKIPAVGKDRDKEKDKNRESEIYESVNINLLTVPPPEPPAITTLPRPPPSCPVERGLLSLPPATNHLEINSLPSTLRRDPSRHRQTPISQRPPMRLPTEEVYEDIKNPVEENVYEPPPLITKSRPNLTIPKEDNSYEPPPLISRTQPRPTTTLPHTITPMASLPPKVPAKPKNPNHVMSLNRRPNVMSPTRRDVMGPTRPDVMRPTDRKTPDIIAPKCVMPKVCMPEPVKVRNELNSILEKRRNVIQLPVQTIMEPGMSRKPGPSIKPKPPLPVREGFVLPASNMDRGQSDRDSYSSSEDEWTYEPLKAIDPNDL